MKKLSLFLSRKTLLTIYKSSLIRLNRDYGDTIYDEPFNKSFKKKIELFNNMPILLLLEQLKRLHGIVFTKNLVQNLLPIKYCLENVFFIKLPKFF